MFISPLAGKKFAINSFEKTFEITVPLSDTDLQSI